MGAFRRQSQQGAFRGLSPSQETVQQAIAGHARTRPQQSPAHQPASSKCGSRHCQGYAFEESAATVRGSITSRKCACQQWDDVAPAPIVQHEGRPLEKANCDSNGSVVLNCLMNVVVQRVLFSSCQQWMYLDYCDFFFVETCTVVYVHVINSPNRHSDSPNCNVINKALRDEFAVSHGIEKRASPDHGLDSTIPVTMWTYPVTFCCRSTVPVTKTFPFQSPDRHCWRRASHRRGERGKPRMGHWARFPLQCEPRLSTLSISGREQSQQWRRPLGWRRRTGGQNWVHCSKSAWKST